jgi:hypothetical protein
MIDDIQAQCLEYCYDVSATTVYNVIDAIIYGMADFLSFKKDKNNRVSVVIKDDRDTHLFATTVEYNEDEQDDEINNWLVSMTINKEDINPEDSITDNYDTTVKQCISKAGCDRSHMRFVDSLSYTRLCQIFGKTLRNWLDQNAKEDEEMILEDSLFTAACIIEDGVKIFSITPGADIKKRIAKGGSDKDDINNIDVTEAAACTIPMVNSNGLISPVVYF